MGDSERWRPREGGGKGEVDDKQQKCFAIHQDRDRGLLYAEAPGSRFWGLGKRKT